MQPRDGPFQRSLSRPTLTQNEFSKVGKTCVTTVPWHVLFCQGCASSPLPWCRSLHHSLPSLIDDCAVVELHIFFVNFVTQILSLHFLWQVWNDAATQVLLPVPTLFFLWHDLLAGHWCCNRWGQPIVLLTATFDEFSITPNVTTCAKVPLMVMFCNFIRFLTLPSWPWLGGFLFLSLFSKLAPLCLWWFAPYKLNHRFHTVW